jgi:hypothetical protein
MYLTYKFKSIVSASSISSFMPGTVFLPLTLSIDLIILKLKKRQSLIFIMDFASTLCWIVRLTLGFTVIEVIAIV